MSRNRITSISRSEDFGQFATQLKKTAPAAVHSPRRGLIGESVLHHTPMAVAVSANGERTLRPVDAGSVAIHLNNTNPFANEQKESIAGESAAEGLPQSYQLKKQRSYHQRRRKVLEKDRRKSAKLTQRYSARPKLQVVMRSASSQTDPALGRISRPREWVGDQVTSRRECCGGLLTEEESRPISTVGEMVSQNKKLHGTDNLSKQFTLESLKNLASFVIMIILIFWTTSVILDEDVPADFIRMAANYMRSFHWGHYKKQPQTNVEKCLEYVTNFFK